MRKALSNKIRKLEDSSWLAQTIKDKMDIEFNQNRKTPRWDCLNTLHIIINEADNIENHEIYYTNSDKGIKSIVICEIPSFVERYGTNYSVHGMQCKLRGLAERYKDDDGNYIVNVSTTHDLNSATIKDISELLYQIN